MNVHVGCDVMKIARLCSSSSPGSVLSFAVVDKTQHRSILVLFLRCILQHYSCVCVAYFIFLPAMQTLRVLSTTCCKPVFILSLCPTSTVGGRGRICGLTRTQYLSIRTSLVHLHCDVLHHLPMMDGDTEMCRFQNFFPHIPSIVVRLRSRNLKMVQHTAILAIADQ